MKRFPQDVYVRTQAELVELKSRLPKDSVAVLAREVISRLAARDTFEFRTSSPSMSSEIERLSLALIDDDPEAGAKLIKEIRADGTSVEAVYLGYLAGAARLLGAWWDEDRVSFYEVTIGTSRMYAIMRSLQNLFMPSDIEPLKSAVFASVPEETHTLGVHMAADIFRKEGWDIDMKIGYSHDELIDEIERSKRLVIGLSAAGSHSIDILARLVVSLRIVCPGAFILVSGKVVDEAPDLVSVMGVDAIAHDITSAKTAMDRLWKKSVFMTSE